ncbi:hypothetical protein CBR_g257 [Chara braunii]|uniref:EF-hand domain-containing protein n=1 Tax=Chara braunii TaxID=69332 RepID=A0A388JM28_CHABU|nr:hypothetical protein CBR_g257 [Chara braunii]|eukprot:GBG58858.1 hypothetical protein CBR_g257 [Chara braunii]
MIWKYRAPDLFVDMKSGEFKWVGVVGLGDVVLALSALGRMYSRNRSGKGGSRRGRWSNWGRYWTDMNGNSGGGQQIQNQGAGQYNPAPPSVYVPNATGQPQVMLNQPTMLAMPVVPASSGMPGVPNAVSAPQYQAQQPATQWVFTAAVSTVAVSTAAMSTTAVSTAAVSTVAVSTAAISIAAVSTAAVSIEPRQDNSGITQGQFLKRHVVPSTVAKNGKTVTIEDLHVGQEVTMYGRTFHICSCDPFTRRFLLRSGIPVADDEPLPDEPIEHYRARQKRIPIRHKRDFKTMQFLKHDGKVLRFFCIWDDRGSVYGDRRPYVLHYYLADDTIEILEVAERNNGRDPFPLLLRRGRLPRETPENLLGRHAFLTSMPDSAFYHEKDLRIGSFIRVYDRDLLLHDCDEYTYQHYRTKWGLTDEDLMPVDIQEPPPVLPQNMIPPHNGFGQEKDALQNCISLIPKPLRKDFNKLMTNDGKEMCFSAHLVEDDEHKLAAADHGRRFIITYYLVDDTVQIYEPAIRNSGIVGGRFLSRYATAPKNDLSGDDYQPEDLFVGQLLYMYNRVFRLEEADEWTYKYMELHPRRFPYSHYGIVMNKISEFLASHYSTAEGQEQARKIFIEADCEGTGHLSVTEAHAAFLELGLCLAEQEVVTLMRMLGVNEEKKVSLENLFTSMGFH